MVAPSSKPKRPPPAAAAAADPRDVELLKSDVASFACSLGLSSSIPSSGFNDADFRRKGPLKPRPAEADSGPAASRGDDRKSKGKGKGGSGDAARRDKAADSKDDGPARKPEPKAKRKPPVLSVDENGGRRGASSFDKFRNLPKLPLVKASALGVWYVDAEELEAKVVGEKGKKLEVSNVDEWKAVVEEKRKLGERLMAQYAQDYESSRGQSGDVKMVVATQRSGTASDKVSAFSVMVGDNPIANLRSLDGLIGMVISKVGKRHALTGFEVLKELFISSLLPERKLKTLLQRPLNHLPETKDGYSLLLFWYWEDCLKQRYERFIVALEEASRDMLPILKDKALRTMYALLKNKSEQERRLLSALVNKLGDPQNKGASNADFHLSNLLSEHPNMKAVVIDEVDSFLFRPHLNLRAKYHAINFLSQIRLSNKGDGPKLAKRLIDVYFAVFKVLITEVGSGQQKAKSGKKERKRASGSEGEKEKDATEAHVELDSRILSVLLTGVNRAFPYVSNNEADDFVEVQTPLLFRLVHSNNFNVGIQALMLLNKISSKNQIASDRFYRALYSKLLLPTAMNSSKAEMFIGLLLRVMKSDVNLKRVAAFSKRLLQVALQQPPQYACGYLFLLSELLKARPPLWNVVLQSELVDEELEHFEDIVEEADKKEINDSREENNSIVDDSVKDDDSSEEEDGLPICSSDDDELSDEASELLIKNESPTTQGVELSKNKIDQSGVNSTDPLLPGGYNPRHREPSYCNADRVSWWELTVLASHVHPSVATMAQTLLSGANIVYNGNPLNDLSLPAFLDKLMEKKPKQSSWHGGSQIEPAKKLDMNNQLIGPEILSLAETDVPPEDLVFHKFYINKMNSSNKQKKKKKKKGADEEAAEELYDVDDAEVDGGDESDNEEIENMLDSADISLDGNGEYDYDDLERVAAEDDDDLAGDASEGETDLPFDMDEGEEDDIGPIEDDDIGPIEDDGSDDEDDEDDVAIGVADDETDEEEDSSHRRKGKRKSRGKTSASPFASLEDYEHLFKEDTEDAGSQKSTKKKSKSRKKDTEDPGLQKSTKKKSKSRKKARSSK
ncbi:CCAAT/enhancer-binding protein zeta [Eucalyptus grandis]|uniref:CCAAT/enhancer-binding protein zeta n=1 Tax=Eucalyptus grandis TaxID=71139 RepID=UPI00192EE89A|nr:CCAAT/enhancer-binding protein zeta [Eucalyptus grandis]